MFTTDTYPYFEEVNEGILRQVPAAANGMSGAAGRVGHPCPLVLDVGCGQGSLAAEIADLGYEVWGIEQDAYAAQRAAARIDCVVHADLTDAEAVRARLDGQRFQRIVFSDVLEHVYDPLTVLRSYLDYLAPDGRVLISLPNVVNWQTRLAFLFGRFTYQDSGVLDRTHIRFFTFKTAVDMVRRAGLEVEIVDHTPFLARAALPLAKRLLTRGGAPADEDQAKAIIDSPAYRLYMRYVYPVEHGVGSLRRSLLAFRIVIVARRAA